MPVSGVGEGEGVGSGVAEGVGSAVGAGGAEGEGSAAAVGTGVCTGSGEDDGPESVTVGVGAGVAGTTFSSAPYISHSRQAASASISARQPAEIRTSSFVVRSFTYASPQNTFLEAS